MPAGGGRDPAFAHHSLVRRLSSGQNSLRLPALRDKDLLARRRTVEPLGQVLAKLTDTNFTRIRCSVRSDGTSVHKGHRPFQPEKSVSSGSRSPRNEARSTSTQPSPRDSASVRACLTTRCPARIPRQAAIPGNVWIRSR